MSHWGSFRRLGTLSRLEEARVVCGRSVCSSVVLSRSRATPDSSFFHPHLPASVPLVLWTEKGQYVCACFIISMDRANRLANENMSVSVQLRA